MKVGIRFGDNDFHTTMKAFVAMFIVPTFIEREKGHFITHLTSSMIVELFNIHVPHIDRYTKWFYANGKHFQYNKKFLHENSLSNYFIITEENVYWDDKTDDFIESWEGNNDGQFTWTNGMEIFTS